MRENFDEFGQNRLTKAGSTVQTLMKPQVVRAVLPWVGFVMLSFTLYHLCSDGRLSGVITLCAGFECFSYIVLLGKAITQPNLSGLSMKTLFLLGIALASKLFTNTGCENYLPLDRSGDWLYALLDFTSILCIICICSFYYYRKRHSPVPFSVDSTYPGGVNGQLSDSFPVYVPLAIAFVVAFFFHPTRCRGFYYNFCWAFSCYLNATAAAPQVYMLSKWNGVVENLTGHFIAAQGASHFCMLCFWFLKYQKLGPAGYAIIVATFIQNILTADFIYLYLKSFKTGSQFVTLGNMQV